MWFINKSLRKYKNANNSGLIYTDYIHPDVPKNAKIVKLFEDRPNLYMMDDRLHIYDRLTGRRLTIHPKVAEPTRGRKRRKKIQKD